MAWQRRRILIWGKTRPELSSKYREIVCTGGVLRETRELIRLYPIPLRYMNDAKVFKKYQWIEAEISPNPSDPRPESYRIRAENIECFETIKPGRDWGERANWVLAPGNKCRSVEDLQDWQVQNRRSLALVKPAEVMSVEAVPVGASETAAFMERYAEATKQLSLSIDLEMQERVKPLLAPEYQFRIHFRCNDSRCRKHAFSVRDWETDALYFKMRRTKGHPEHIAVRKVKQALESATAPDKDLYFFLGNISTHPHIFTIVGLWHPKKSKQLKLDVGADEDDEED